MKGKRIILPAFCLPVMAVLVGLLLSRLALTIPSMRAMDEATYTPFMITYRETAYSSAGVAGSQNNFLEAKRRNGDQATISFRSDNHSSNYLRVIMLYSRGINIHSNTYNSYTSTTGKGMPIIRRQPDATCRTDIPREAQRLGTDTMFGFNVLHVREEGSESSRDIWFAPDLGCANLRQIDRWKNPDGTPDGLSMTVREALQVQATDPLDDYFAVPSNPIDIPPTVYWSTVVHPGRPMPPYLQKADMRYWSDQAQRTQSVTK